MTCPLSQEMLPSKLGRAPQQENGYQVLQPHGAEGWQWYEWAMDSLLEPTEGSTTCHNLAFSPVKGGARAVSAA